VKQKTEYEPVAGSPRNTAVSWPVTSFDARNPSHKMLMSVLGGMSESERQHVQARVRAAMDAQVVNEGRHQGGRAPYGYVVVDGGPHPNPRKAAEGFRLRVLTIDPEAADVVQRIFAEYMEGVGDRAIAKGLNQDGVPCPSERRRDQNRHRLADGWQGSTVRSILENPRYTGYAIFGRWTKHETLLNPDDVGAGHVVRFRRAEPERVVRSRRPAHPEIVSVETFTQAQLVRRSRAAGGMRGIAKLDRDRSTTKHTYLLKGLVRCEICTRKVQGAAIRKGVYYRCIARTLAPGSAALADHPKTVNLREDVVTPPINEWLCQIFHPDNRDATVAALIGTQDGRQDSRRAAAEKRLKDAEAKLRRHQAAIDAGVDPAALVEPMNHAQAERQAAKEELQHLPEAQTVDVAEVYAMLDQLGDVARHLNSRSPDRIMQVYRDLGLQVVYDNKKEAVAVTASPRVGNVCVRGRSCSLSTRLQLLA
jgi:hypothetical protein